MSTLKKFFPFSFKTNDVVEFIISLVNYVVIGIIGGAIIGFLASIPILGIIFSVIGYLLGLYTLVGIILSVLSFVKVIK